MSNIKYTPTSVRKLVDKFFSLQWCRDNLVVPLFEETSLPLSEGILKIAIANYSYLGVLSDFIKHRIKQDSPNIEIIFIEKSRDEIEEMLDKVSML